MNSQLYQELLEAKAKREKKFAILIDPDCKKLDKLDKIIEESITAKVDFFFIGGSLLINDKIDKVLSKIKATCDIPCILFPGNSFQINENADAILFLSLISGRNADLLIGQQVLSAPYLKKSSLEVISTGYMLVDGGNDTTVSYISNTRPIPYSNCDVAISTALAGELLGMKCIYMDAGSGAKNSISEEMISAVSSHVDVPIIVGGGIKTSEEAMRKYEAGADIVVIGNAIENNPSLIHEITYQLKDNRIYKV